MRKRVPDYRIILRHNIGPRIPISRTCSVDSVITGLRRVARVGMIYTQCLMWCPLEINGHEKFKREKRYSRSAGTGSHPPRLHLQPWPLMSAHCPAALRQSTAAIETRRAPMLQRASCVCVNSGERARVRMRARPVRPHWGLAFDVKRGAF